MNVFKGKCEICTINDSKYKCPKCFFLYCSLNCYKTHKENCADLKVNQTSDDSKTARSSINLQDNVTNIQSVPEDNVSYEIKDVLGDFVPIEKLKMLEQSEELKEILANKHLREFLTKLNDGDDNQNIDLKVEKAMQEPLFQEFSDICLKIVQKDTDSGK